MLLAIVTFAATVDSIRIESKWAGLGKPSDKVYRIKPRDEKAVDRLVAALEAAPVNRLSAAQSIATPEWVAAMAHRPHEDASGIPRCSDEARRLYEQRLADPFAVQEMLNHYFSTIHSDDYPFVT